MEKQIFVGGTLDDAGRRFVDAWHRAERGEIVEPEDNITFVSWAALSNVMTQKRYELLCHRHLHPANSVRALARDLGRDFKRVHGDVAALEEVGLIEREDGQRHADYNVINASIYLRAAAA